MLNFSKKEPSRTKTSGSGRRKWHDEIRNVLSIGCSMCPEYSMCGGLRVSKPLFWCLDYCCGKPEVCDVVCRNNPRFVEYVREIGGFDLDTVARAPLLTKPSVSVAIPLIFHGNSRRSLLRTSAAALPLSRMFGRRSGQPRFVNRADQCSAFGICPSTSVILSGTVSDPPH